MTSDDARSRRARHPVSAIGIALTTISAVLFLFLWVLETFGWIENPYLGLFAFIAVPLLFVFGLLLIPLGRWLAGRRARRGLPEAAPWPRLDLNDRRGRRFALLFLLATVVNLLIVVMAGYEAVHYMESPRFCGQLCHQPMAPHFVQWQNAAHSRVPCVACHVGSGAGSFVHAKLQGTRQLVRVALGTFERPLPTPVQDMRPARFTCERCHSPERVTGEKLKELREYADDEANTETRTVLRLHVGDGAPSLSRGTGIHWHTYPGNEIEYIATDAKRESIPWVRLKDRTGRVQTFVVDGFDGANPGVAPRRMDCIDCHSRPAHPFATSPERAVDRSIALGRLDRSLPFIRREAVRVLKSSDAAADGDQAIQRWLEAFYRDTYPDIYRSRLPAIARSSAVAQELRSTHVFPGMKITWGTYPNQRGHVDAPGCFRCHDDSHKAADGTVIRQDCEMCHSIDQPQ